MKTMLAISAIFSIFTALIIFFHSMQNAFKKSFMWGMIFIMFPIGSFFYYKNFLQEEKKSAIFITITSLFGVIAFLIAKII